MPTSNQLFMDAFNRAFVRAQNTHGFYSVPQEQQRPQPIAPDSTKYTTKDLKEGDVFVCVWWLFNEEEATIYIKNPQLYPKDEAIDRGRFLGSKIIVNRDQPFTFAEGYEPRGHVPGLLKKAIAESGIENPVVALGAGRIKKEYLMKILGRYSFNIDRRNINISNRVLKSIDLEKVQEWDWDLWKPPEIIGEKEGLVKGRVIKVCPEAAKILEYADVAAFTRAVETKNAERINANGKPTPALISKQQAEMLMDPTLVVGVIGAKASLNSSSSSYGYKTGADDKGFFEFKRVPLDIKLIAKADAKGYTKGTHIYPEKPFMLTKEREKEECVIIPLIPESPRPPGEPYLLIVPKEGDKGHVDPLKEPFGIKESNISKLPPDSESVGPAQQFEFIIKNIKKFPKLEKNVFGYVQLILFELNNAGRILKVDWKPNTITFTEYKRKHDSETNKFGEDLPLTKGRLNDKQTVAFSLTTPQPQYAGLYRVYCFAKKRKGELSDAEWRNVLHGKSITDPTTCLYDYNYIDFELVATVEEARNYKTVESEETKKAEAAEENLDEEIKKFMEEIQNKDLLLDPNVALRWNTEKRREHAKKIDKMLTHLLKDTAKLFKLERTIVMRLNSKDELAKLNCLIAIFEMFAKKSKFKKDEEKQKIAADFHKYFKDELGITPQTINTSLLKTLNEMRGEIEKERRTRKRTRK